MDEEEFEEIDLHEIAVARRELSEAKGFGDEDKRRQIEKLFGSAPSSEISKKKGD